MAEPDTSQMPATPSDTVQSLWVGERLSRIETLSIASFLAHGHRFHLYTYGDVGNVPTGVELRDAGELIPEREVFQVNGSLAIFADWFRQQLLYARGGYWVDLDMVCLRPLDFPDAIVVGKVEPQRASNSILRFPQGHEVTRDLAHLTRHPNTVMPYDNASERRRKLVRRYLLGNHQRHVKWGEASGPSGLTRMLKHRDLFKLAKPYYFFYPLHHSFWFCAFDDTFAGGSSLFAQSYCLHLWNEKIRKFTGVNKDGPFRKGSLVQQLMDRYGC
jgi:hypothetical protein